MGDPACWLDQVCAHCGYATDVPRDAVRADDACPRCGTAWSSLDDE